MPFFNKVEVWFQDYAQFATQSFHKFLGRYVDSGLYERSTSDFKMLNTLKHWRSIGDTYSGGSMNNVIFGLVFLARQFVHLILRYTTQGRFQLMDPTDAACCVDYERFPANYILCFHVRTNINEESLQKLRDKVSKRIVTSPYKKLQFRLCTKFGFLCWEDLSSSSEFNITDHIKLCPEVSTWEKTISQNDLMSLAKTVMNSSLQSKGKPDWEILVVPRLAMKGSLDYPRPEILSTLIIRLNHGYMDANCAIKFVQDCIFDGERTTSSITTLNMPTDSESFLSRMTLFIRVFLYGPMHMTSFLQSISKRSIVNETCSGPTFIGRSKLNMSYATLNKIRMAFECETKSIVTHALLTAISRSAETSGFSMPKQLNISFAHAMPPYNEELLENKFSVVLRTVPTFGPNQLAEIDKKIRVTKRDTHEVIVIFWLGKVVGCLPLKLFRLLRKDVACPCTLTMVAASEHRFKFQGGIVESGFGVPPLVDGSQYMSSIGIYGGTLRVTFHIACTPLVKHQHDFQNLITEFDNCLINLQEQANFKIGNRN
ncbi:unnamed protein product [Orchesella dallaii]|uniref:O-acyltransferase WSD1 C-terminal domain-containing protein n=1 Tax=Orchesella dallaii TaxID=48710 RepID=A0ABP1RGQ4_9HEXA